MAAEKRTAAVSELEERSSPAKVTKTEADQTEVPKAAEIKEAGKAEALPAENGQKEGADAAKIDKSADDKATPAADAVTNDQPSAPASEDGKAVPDESQTEAPVEPVADPEIKTKPAVTADAPAPTSQEA